MLFVQIILSQVALLVIQKLFVLAELVHGKRGIDLFEFSLNIHMVVESIAVCKMVRAFENFLNTFISDWSFLLDGLNLFDGIWFLHDLDFYQFVLVVRDILLEDWICQLLEGLSLLHRIDKIDLITQI